MRRIVKNKQPNSKMCFVCGMENSFGLKSMFYELDDGQLMALFTPQKEHQGYPGRLHGGIAATILDEAIGRAINIASEGDTGGVTVDFSMKLRKPVPIDREIRVFCRIVSENRRSFEGEGEIVLEDGTVAVQGKGKYLKMDIDNIADFDHEGDEWVVVPISDDPESVELVKSK